MKNLLLLLGIICISCDPEPIKSDWSQYEQQGQQDCGIIIASGHDQRGDYICVKMSYQSQGEYNRYKVSNYQSYQLNTQICNFDGLTKEAN